MNKQILLATVSVFASTAAMAQDPGAVISNGGVYVGASLGQMSVSAKDIIWSDRDNAIDGEIKEDQLYLDGKVTTLNLVAEAGLSSRMVAYGKLVYGFERDSTSKYENWGNLNSRDDLPLTALDFEDTSVDNYLTTDLGVKAHIFSYGSAKFTTSLGYHYSNIAFTASGATGNIGATDVTLSEDDLSIDYSQTAHSIYAGFGIEQEVGRFGYALDLKYGRTMSLDTEMTATEAGESSTRTGEYNATKFVGIGIGASYQVNNNMSLFGRYDQEHIGIIDGVSNLFEDGDRAGTQNFSHNFQVGVNYAF